MNPRKQAIVIIFLLPLFISMAYSEEENHSFLNMDFFGKLFNFIVLFGGLALLLRKYISNYIKKRVTETSDSIKESKKLEKKSEKNKAEIKSRLDKLKTEIEKIKTESEKDGKKEKERIIKLAERESERIKEMTKEEMDRILQTRIQELKEYTAELSIKRARERIKKNISDKDQSILINRSIEELGSLYEKSNSSKKIHSRTH
ncbi:MAG: hypothetical protein ACOC5F_02590 [Candidatus Aminicenantaceae bacterium]